MCLRAKRHRERIPTARCSFSARCYHAKHCNLGATHLVFTAWAASASASTAVFTEKAAWDVALGGQFLTEYFADDLLNVGVSFVSSESGHINPAAENYQDVLASASQNEPMTVWSFDPQITAFGGEWTLGGPGGSGNSLLVYLADSSSYVGTIANSYNGGFWGFTSDSPFNSVKLIGGTGSNQQHYSLDNMVYAPVAEPGLPGDFDRDDDVDGADFLLWQRGEVSNPPSSADLALWQAHYGESPTLFTTGLPEPTTGATLLLGLIVPLLLRNALRT